MRYTANFASEDIAILVVNELMLNARCRFVDYFEHFKRYSKGSYWQVRAVMGD